MINMAYCRFHNTLAALLECRECWDDETSPAEEKERARLLALIRRMAEENEE
jgi:hypothetical protein